MHQIESSNFQHQKPNIAFIQYQPKDQFELNLALTRSIKKKIYIQAFAFENILKIKEASWLRFQLQFS